MLGNLSCVGIRRVGEHTCRYSVTLLNGASNDQTVRSVDEIQIPTKRSNSPRRRRKTETENRDSSQLETENGHRKERSGLLYRIASTKLVTGGEGLRNSAGGGG